MTNGHGAAFTLGIFICIGLFGLGMSLGSSIHRLKGYERVVTVKGLAEREVPADIAVWPITFASANNDVTALYATMEENTKEILAFLRAAGFSDAEITTAAPVVTDKFAQRYGTQEASVRYTAQQTITVYSQRIDFVRASQSRLAELGKKGIAFGGEDYNQRTQFLFTKLNDLKPAMIEEATRNARAVAEKFAADSQSRLGKLKRASQGQFTIEDRDSNTPYIKRVRVVSTVEYYLSD
ncbi:MAG: SIMPL domain-containing protein [Desulfosoma sp.]